VLLMGRFQDAVAGFSMRVIAYEWFVFYMSVSTTMWFTTLHVLRCAAVKQSVVFTSTTPTIKCKQRFWGVLCLKSLANEVE
jgi:hypothetical protein